MQPNKTTNTKESNFSTKIKTINRQKVGILNKPSIKLSERDITSMVLLWFLCNHFDQESPKLGIFEISFSELWFFPPPYSGLFDKAIYKYNFRGLSQKIMAKCVRAYHAYDAKRVHALLKNHLYLPNRPILADLFPSQILPKSFLLSYCALFMPRCWYILWYTNEKMFIIYDDRICTCMLLKLWKCKKPTNLFVNVLVTNLEILQGKKFDSHSNRESGATKILVDWTLHTCKWTMDIWSFDTWQVQKCVSYFRLTLFSPCFFNGFINYANLQ